MQSAHSTCVGDSTSRHSFSLLNKSSIEVPLVILISLYLSVFLFFFKAFLGLCWVFVTALRLFSLVVASRGFSGCGAQALRYSGFGSCGPVDSGAARPGRQCAGAIAAAQAQWLWRRRNGCGACA